MHGLRPEFQQRLNFVVLDYDLEADRALARDLGLPGHPSYAVVAPDGDAGESSSAGSGRSTSPRCAR